MRCNRSIMQEFSPQQKTRLKNLAQKYNLKLLILFGSQVEGKTHLHSDYDIAALGRKPNELRNAIPDFANECAEALEISSDKIDISLIDRANPLLLHEISENAVLLYGTQYDFDNFNAYCFKQYIDYQPYFKMEENAVNDFIKQHA